MRLLKFLSEANAELLEEDSPDLYESEWIKYLNVNIEYLIFVFICQFLE